MSVLSTHDVRPNATGTSNNNNRKCIDCFIVLLFLGAKITKKLSFANFEGGNIVFR